MTDIIFNYVESAVKLENLLITLIFSIVASLIFGIITLAITKELRSCIIIFIITLVLQIIVYFVIRDNVHSNRLNEIRKIMSAINISKIDRSFSEGGNISNWREGLIMIGKNPYEIGFYISTIKYFEQDNDFECAATLLEMGLDFFGENGIPIIICDKLQQYYIYLPNRPRIDSECKKIHKL